MRRSLSLTVALFTLSLGAAAWAKPAIKILATGGTIAGAQASAQSYGYKSGSFKVEDLINAVPHLKELANLSGEQVANIGSQDMNDDVWLKLAKRVNEVLADPDVDGVVITHGTDTMEETAYLPRTSSSRATSPSCSSARCGPRPPSAPTVPANLYNAVAVAAEPGRQGARRAGRAQRRDPRGAQRHEDQHDQRRHVQEPEPRPRWPRAHRPDRLVRADGQAPHDEVGVRRGKANAAAARRHHLRARQHEPRPDRRRRQERRQGDRHRRRRRRQHDEARRSTRSAEPPRPASSSCAARASPRGSCCATTRSTTTSSGSSPRASSRRPSHACSLQLALTKTNDVKQIQRMFDSY